MTSRQTNPEITPALSAQRLAGTFPGDLGVELTEITDERVRGREITLGAGEHGLALAADADEILRVLDASVADISDPEPVT